MKPAFVLFFLISFFQVFCFAEDADTTKIQLKVNAPDSIQAGKQYRISFEFNANNGEKLKVPEFKNLQVIGGPYTSTTMSTTITGGKQTSTYSIVYTFVVEAEKKGTATIGEASVLLKDKEYKSKKVKIIVVPNIDEKKPDDKNNRKKENQKEKEIPKERQQKQKRDSEEGIYV